MIRRMAGRGSGLLVGLDRDERGTISIVSVFAVMLLTMLLGMVMNVGRHADGKIRMQNAADAAAYSGGTVIARGMNTLAFSNHLLFDVFALTAFMREAEAGNSAVYVPEILAAWTRVGSAFSGSGFPKFDRLGPAIIQKASLEQDLVRTYSRWAAASSERILPMLEEILEKELIPEFQRALVEAIPDIAQEAAMQVALRSGRPDRGRGPLRGVLWRSSGMPVCGASDLLDRTLPVVDPVGDTLVNQTDCAATARRQRRQLAHKYLRDWNNDSLHFFDRHAKMCQFSSLWRSFTCGYCNELLEVAYPDSNLPHLIRTKRHDVIDGNTHLQQYFTFLGVVYWQQLPEMLPGLFQNPTDNDAVAYAEVRMFIPRRRLVWASSAQGVFRLSIGGVPGEFPDISAGEEPRDDTDDEERWFVVRQPRVSTSWDLLNQHWTVNLVPATMPALTTILQTVPNLPEFSGEDVELPNLGSLTTDEISRISPH